MTDKTLSKARGLNSIADPRSFKGASGRRRAGETEQPPPAPTRPVPPDPAIDRVEPHRPPDAREHASQPPPPPPVAAAAPATAPPPLVPVPAPVEPVPALPRDELATQTVGAAPPPHRAVNPGVNRKRRELSVPHLLADALERTGINPADVVMAAYRKHSNSIYAGEGGRMTAKGRTRLRLSISDAEFEQLTRLGQARGWNRSETVSVILALELLGQPTTPSAAIGP